MRIALITARSLEEKQVSSGWSLGISFMAKALRKYCGDVSYLGPIKGHEANSFPVLLDRALNKASLILLRKRFNWRYGLALSKRYGKIFTQRISEKKFDLIFAPAAKSEIAFLDTKLPIIYLTDSTYAQMINYYPLYFSNLKSSLDQGNFLESRAVEKAKMILCPSEWAAKSLSRDYHANKGKIHVVPLGANIEEEDIPQKETVLKKRKSADCRLLFIGVDWARKGGEIALETFFELEKLGIKAELTICGCVPPKKTLHNRLKIIPYANKEERNALYQSSDFLIFPTRAECFGTVLSEAGAFGLPAVTTDTGGIPSLIQDKENGIILPLSARGMEYAKAVADIYKNDDLYRRMSRSSRQIFEDRLNWDAWGRAVNKRISEMDWSNA